MAFTIKGSSLMVEKGTYNISGCYGHEEVQCNEVIGYPPSWFPWAWVRTSW